MSVTRHHPPIVGSPLTLPWLSEEDTLAFARALAARPAIADAFIALRGDLGAGKTTFVRHLLRALGVQGRIKSPTYAVVEPHEATAPGGAPMHAWHFDFYRFNDPREWEDAGFRDLFASEGLKLAEWPDQAAGLLPTPDLAIAIDVLDDDTRRVTVTPGTAKGRGLLP
ncbi:MAG: tRNA (adenosine(37)-N6)-threonylcarbamoyltransferase complex ATPase subunit type 1 TsaE [Pseudomonadota bacterium]